MGRAFSSRGLGEAETQTNILFDRQSWARLANSKDPEAKREVLQGMIAVDGRWQPLTGYDGLEQLVNNVDFRPIPPSLKFWGLVPEDWISIWEVWDGSLVGD